MKNSNSSSKTISHTVSARLSYEWGCLPVKIHYVSIKNSPIRN